MRQYPAYLEEQSGANGLRLSLVEKQGLRYGENPHQNASYLVEAGKDVPWKQLAGKELSFNNILDLSIAISWLPTLQIPCAQSLAH